MWWCVVVVVFEVSGTFVNDSKGAIHAKNAFGACHASGQTYGHTKHVPCDCFNLERMDIETAESAESEADIA